MSAAEIPDACAACGKAGDGLKKCTSCQLVKYCGRECQASDWKIHKRACKKKAAELHDEALFRQPPPRDDCPICFLRLPASGGEKHYQPCCGQVLCAGCVFASGNKLNVCPFCRGKNLGDDLAAIDKCMIQQYQRRVEANDAGAMYVLGIWYIRGSFGVAKDSAKAHELWERAGKLGNQEANTCLAGVYAVGDGVKRDPEKAKHYYELAAMGGDVDARYKLGLLELESDKKLRRVLKDFAPKLDLESKTFDPQERAVKHFIIAAKGHELAMKDVTSMRELISKQEYEETLRAFIKVTKEMRSDQRDNVWSAFTTCQAKAGK